MGPTDCCEISSNALFKLKLKKGKKKVNWDQLIHTCSKGLACVVSVKKLVLT